MQDQFEIIVAASALALRGDIGGQRVGRSEQPECLIDQMRAEIGEQPGTLPTRSLPTRSRGKAKAIPTRLVEHRHADPILGEQPRDGLEITIPAAVVEHAEHTPP